MKARDNFKIYDVTNWEINNCNTHIVQLSNILRSKRNQTMKGGIMIFKTHTEAQTLIPDLFFFYF